jgi:hydroxymethylglutaryl-CoA reductase (NADPH)
MHATFVHLFINMRKIGSSFWLRKWNHPPLVCVPVCVPVPVPVPADLCPPFHPPVKRPLTYRLLAFATLVSSIFGFLVALLAAYLLNVPIDPVCMSEALPFLVITVGFDKPFQLARAVFQNPDIAPIAASPEMSPIAEDPFEAEGKGLGLDLGVLHKELAPLERLQRLAEGKGVRWAAPVAAKQIVVDAVKKAGVNIVRDYAIEIAVLSVGAASGIGGLREFCYLGESAAPPASRHGGQSRR